MGGGEGLKAKGKLLRSRWPRRSSWSDILYSAGAIAFLGALIYAGERPFPHGLRAVPPSPLHPPARPSSRAQCPVPSTMPGSGARVCGCGCAVAAGVLAPRSDILAPDRGYAPESSSIAGFPPQPTNPLAARRPAALYKEGDATNWQQAFEAFVFEDLSTYSLDVLSSIWLLARRSWASHVFKFAAWLRIALAQDTRCWSGYWSGYTGSRSAQPGHTHA
jgi:hypothetical protein